MKNCINYFLLFEALPYIFSLIECPVSLRNASNYEIILCSFPFRAKQLIKSQFLFLSSLRILT